MKTQEQIDARDRKELAQRKKQKNKKALKYGLLLTLLALFLASVTDEISSAIGVQVQSSVVTEFFVRPLNVPYNEAMAMFSTATTFSYAVPGSQHSGDGCRHGSGLVVSQYGSLFHWLRYDRVLRSA